MRTAIVHDWLTGQRGGERCLETFCRILPDAEIFTLFHARGSVSPLIEQRTVHTSFLQKFPGSSRYYRHLLPLFPMAIESLDLSGFDLVLSSSHCVAKGVIPPPEAQHICYCYTPMRYVWDMRSAYFAEGRSSRMTRTLMALLGPPLRAWDTASSARVDRFVAISQFVASRIRKYYRRESEVVYPPVNCSMFHPSDNDEGYYLLVSALVPYKETGLAVEVFRRLGLRLRIVGSGPGLRELRGRAGNNVELVGQVSDRELAQHYQGARALVFPAREDFGIVPLEAQAAGKPVIAYGSGGALETIRGTDAFGHLGRFAAREATGVFFERQTVMDLEAAVRFMEENRSLFRKEACRENALRFDLPRFESEMRRILPG